MHHGNIPGFRFQVRALVIEEHVGLQNIENPVLLHTPQKKHLIGIHTPVLQGGNYPLMGRSIASRHDGRAQYPAITGIRKQRLILQRL